MLRNRKEYGTCKFAEGGKFQNKKLLIVEDVVTSGGAILDAVYKLRNEGAIVNNVISVIDRQGSGRENLERENLKFSPLFTKEFIEKQTKE